MTQLLYQAAITPTVTSISPRRGSTAGGTLITLTVVGLPLGIDVDGAAVRIAGLPCKVQSVTVSEVICLTASYGVTSVAKPGSGPVRLTLLATGTAAATSNATYEYIDLWSRYQGTMYSTTVLYMRAKTYWKAVTHSLHSVLNLPSARKIDYPITSPQKHEHQAPPLPPPPRGAPTALGRDRPPPRLGV